MTFVETEEKLIIETPERVQLEFSLASIGNRFLAALIDHLICFLAILSIYYFSAFFDHLSYLFENEEISKWITAFTIAVVFTIYFGYFAVFEWFWNGQTPGKHLMKLRVIREDGRPIGIWEALIRNFLRIVDAFPSVYSVGLITVFLSKHDQRIGDLFAGTVVVRERAADEILNLDDILSNNLEEETSIQLTKPVNFQADLSLLKPEEMAVVRAFLQRRLDLDANQRLWLAWRIALPIMYKLKPKYNLKGFTYEGFLEELFHCYNQMKKL